MKKKDLVRSLSIAMVFLSSAFQVQAEEDINRVFRTAFEEALGRIRSGRIEEGIGYLQALAGYYEKILVDGTMPWTDQQSVYVKDREATIRSLASIQYNLGWAYLAKKDARAAIPWFDKALQRDPTLLAAYANRGEAKRLSGDPEGALKDFDRAIQGNGQDAAALAGRGMIRLQKSEYAASIADLNEAIRLVPNYPVAYAARGEAKRLSGDPEGALCDFDKALGGDRQNIVALEGRGFLRFQRKDFPAAVADLTEAVRLDPGNALVYSYRGEARRLLGDPDGAIRDFSKAIEVKPGSAETLAPNLAAAYLSRGTSQSALGKLAEAAMDYGKAGTLGPDGATALQSAAALKDMKLAAYLLKNGADVNARDRNGATAFLYAVRAGSLDVLRLLLQAKADPEARGVLWIDREKNTWYGCALSIAADAGVPMAVLRFLVEECGADVNRGDIDAKTGKETTCLAVFRPCMSGDFEKASYLLEKGSDVRASYQGVTLLLAALTQGNIDERIPLLLLERGLTADPKDPRTLQNASYKGFSRVVERLLAAGLDPRAADGNGLNALHYAAAGSGDAGTARMLLDHGAPAKAASTAGWTALHLAAQGGHEDLCALLLERGADVNAVLRAGEKGSVKEYTALALASANGHAGTAALLRKAGAR